MPAPVASAHITIDRAGFRRAEDFTRAVSGNAVRLRIKAHDVDHIVAPIVSTSEGERSEIRLEWNFDGNDDATEEAEHQAEVLRIFAAERGLQAEAEDADGAGVYILRRLSVMTADDHGALLVPTP